MTIQLTQARVVSGSVAASGSQHTLDEATEAYFVEMGWATYVGAEPYQGGSTVPASLATDANGNTTGLVGPDGPVLYGEMVSGTWMKCPSVFRLRLTGTGSVQLDSRDSAGAVTAVATYTLSGATDQIEFPYAGDNAVAIRATLTGTTSAEVI